MSLLGLLSLSLLAAPPTPTAPPLVTLVTSAWSETSELRIADRAVARFTHLAGAAVRGAMSPGTDQFLAIADTSPRRDPSFAASLFILTATAPARRLCDDVVHASRPLVAPDGRVFVVRGAAGPDILPDPRLDFLRIDEIDRDTGVARTIHQHTGQFLHLAGWHDETILAYRIAADSADLVAIDAAPPHAVHPLADIPPFARDFSVDRDHLVFHDRDEDDPHTWHIERLDLRTAALTAVASAADMRAQPFAAADEIFAHGPRGLTRTGHAPLAAPCAGAPDCLDVVRIAHTRWLAGLHVRPNTLPRPFILDAVTGAATMAPAPDAWIDLVGFLPGGAR